MPAKQVMLGMSVHTSSSDNHISSFLLHAHIQSTSNLEHALSNTCLCKFQH
jgi:hypothetical protein